MVERIWRESLSRLREQVDPQSFTTWIEPIHPAGFTDGVLSLTVPNTFMAEWLEKYFVEVISSSVRAVEPECRSITIRQVPRAEKTKTTPPAAPDLAPQPIMETTLGTRTDPPPKLNAKYTFDTFITGGANHFAYAASRAVTKSPGSSYNPLFLYGGVGLGKTHLMQAIGHAVWEANPNITVQYMTSEEFTNELITAIQTRSTAAFRAKYRSVDVLLIDDIQFIAGRDSTQEEFFHTFNTLYDAHKQIVLNSDRPPKDIPALEERLVSRFHWGLVTDIQPPDVETRVAILRTKAEQDGLDLPQDVAHFIAQTVSTNIRELEGALIRVTAYASMLGRPVALEMAQEALEGLIPNAVSKPLSIDRIQQAVAAHYDVRIAELKGNRRSRQVVTPRQVAMFLCRDLTQASLTDVGDAFGGRDHTTVMHACRKITDDREREPALRHTLDTLSKQLQETP